MLCIGDAVAASGLQFLSKKLRGLKRQYEIDFCVVNGENAAGVGLTPEQAEEIFSAGADVITTGNHAFGFRQLVPYLDDNPYILRPANFAPQAPGQGWHIYESRMGDIAVIDLIGRVHMDYTPDNPFLCVEKLLKNLPARFILVELHAEASSEKLAMAYMLDGRVGALWGTHTHVPTADLGILPKGTGYVSDLGMTGPMYSVLGIRPELSIRRFCGDVPERYAPAPGPAKLDGAVFTLDENSGLCAGTERIFLHD